MTLESKEKPFGIKLISKSPYNVIIDFPRLPPMGNAWKRENYHVSRKEKAMWVGSFKWMLLNNKPKFPLKKVRLILTRFSSSEPDYDGLVISFKHVIDALVENEVLVDDSLSVTGKWDCNWLKTSRGKGSIRVEIIEE